ncbi:DUF4238 domain-containing protein [Rhizobium leguminosarum]
MPELPAADKETVDELPRWKSAYFSTLTIQKRTLQSCSTRKWMQASMSKTRDNHYVAQWYQQGFFDEGRSSFHYLDLHPQVTNLPNGKSFTAKHKFISPTSRCFYVTDLYTTFFGEEINDEIERRLFGPIDDWGSMAVRAFIGDDVNEWHRHFQQFFEYMDAQKFRTPKGLDWLKKHYPRLAQNDLMREMQGIQRMNCTLWSEGIREIVSAENSDVKFIITDHPVTVYNYAAAPDHELCSDTNEPDIAFKATQTLFPLSKDFCLILTNLEYADDPEGASPLEKRTFARNFRTSMVRTDSFIRSRNLAAADVNRINFVLKSRAHRYIAAGREEWLYPENFVNESWSDLRSVLLPSTDGQWRFGGEMYARMETGEVYYQDQYGRTEKPRDFLKKSIDEKSLKPNDTCGCGSGKKYKKCCQGKAPHLRPSWAELSIRERNLALGRGIVNILGLDKGKEWGDVRRDLTDDQIVRVYSLYEALWPHETDILRLLPKPDGTARALYTGLIDPRMIPEFAIGTCLYFDEVFIENPFLHPGSVKKEFSPVHHPAKFRQEFLKSAFLLICLLPLIEDGIVNLVPDPCNFNYHLRDQMMSLARERVDRTGAVPELDARTKWLMAEGFKRNMLAMPESIRRSELKKVFPKLDQAKVEGLLAYQVHLRGNDPFASIDDGAVKPGEDGGFYQGIKMAPNFEMSLYLARATGAFIFTDSSYRWRELLASQTRHLGVALSNASVLCATIERAAQHFLWDSTAVASMRRGGTLSDYRELINDVYCYALSAEKRGKRGKLDAQLGARYVTVNKASQKAIRKAGPRLTPARMKCIIPSGGLNHNNVSRMLLTSGAEHYLDSVPMAFFIETTNPSAYQQDLL